MKKIRNIFLLICCLMIAGCGKKEQTVEKFHIYYVDEEESVIQSKEQTLLHKDMTEQVQEVIDLLVYSDEEKERILPEDIIISRHEIQDDVLCLDFQGVYRKQSPTDEVLWRGAIVKNFLQISGIGYVKFTIEGEELKDSKGNIVGLMSDNSFLEYSGKEITAYQYTEMELYFTNKDGTKLIPEKRSVYYTSNSSIEKVVVEQLIQGPRKESNYPTIPAKTRILNVSVSEGIAYVNLDQRFITEALPIKEQLPVYSIVNSLIGLGSVQKVQISINGDTKLTFGDTVRLDQLFEKNMELCK